MGQPACSRHKVAAACRMSKGGTVRQYLWQPDTLHATWCCWQQTPCSWSTACLWTAACAL